MSSPYFSLGGISLPWTPSAVSYGFRRHLSKTDLIGGGRVWQDFGPDPEPYVITAKITGEDRYSLRDQLGALSGTSQSLVLGQDTVQVIVGSVTIPDEGWGWIEVRITADVQSPSTAQAQTAPTTVQTVSGLTSNASTLAASIDI